MSTEDTDAVLQQAFIDETRTWYISDDLLLYLELSLTNSLHGLLSVAGVVSNIINMVIFIKLGLRNSMTVGLFALSFTDLMVTLLQLGICGSYLAYQVRTDYSVNPLIFGGYLFSWTRYMAYLVSCWITTLLSVERCYCVVSPFTVRATFTRGRCVCVMTLFYLIHIAVPFPLFIFAKLTWMSVSGTTVDNSTQTTTAVLIVLFNEDSAWWEMLADIIIGVVLSIISQAILFVCTVWMTFALTSSARIRKMSDKQRRDKKEEHLSPREQKMVKTVLSLAVICTVCNVPRFIATAVHHILPGMSRGAYQNLERFLWELAYLFSTMCCTTNIIVYYKINASYRMIFKQMFEVKLSKHVCNIVKKLEDKFL